MPASGLSSTTGAGRWPTSTPVSVIAAAREFLGDRARHDVAQGRGQLLARVADQRVGGAGQRGASASRRRHSSIRSTGAAGRPGRAGSAARARPASSGRGRHCRCGERAGVRPARAGAAGCGVPPRVRRGDWRPPRSASGHAGPAAALERHGAPTSYVLDRVAAPPRSALPALAGRPRGRPRRSTTISNRRSKLSKPIGRLAPRFTSTSCCGAWRRGRSTSQIGVGASRGAHASRRRAAARAARTRRRRRSRAPGRAVQRRRPVRRRPAPRPAAYALRSSRQA